MLGSLRVRLPLVFLAGIVLAGVITTADLDPPLPAVHPEPDPLEAQSRGERDRRALLEAVNAGYGNKNGDEKAPTLRRQDAGEGDRRPDLLARPRLGLFPGQITGLRALPYDRSTGTSASRSRSSSPRPGSTAAISPSPTRSTSSGTTIGAIVVATKKTDIRQQVISLIGRLAIAGVLGLLIAALLAWYLSRRIVRPILQLSDAVDEVAGGNYDVEVPPNAPGRARPLECARR